MASGTPSAGAEQGNDGQGAERPRARTAPPHWSPVIALAGLAADID
jgi:hypothetical protein